MELISQEDLQVYVDSLIKRSGSTTKYNNYICKLNIFHTNKFATVCPELSQICSYTF